MHRFDDPSLMPGTGASPDECFAGAVPLAGTPGQVYVERRGVPADVATAAGVCFQSNFGGRPAVLVALRDDEDTLVSIHGRYLHTVRGQNKMLTIGRGGGLISVLGGWRVEPLILVEGLFDALSLATCGWAAVATIGRWAPWLPKISYGRTVWLAFDQSRPGEIDAARYKSYLCDAKPQRLPPPPRCKDWSTALVKCGRITLTRWVRDSLAADGNLRLTTNPTMEKMFT